MIQNLKEYSVLENDTEIQFLSNQTLEKLNEAEANPMVKFSAADKSIPFIVLSDGSVVVDITANNPFTILKKISQPGSSVNPGAGYIDVYHGNKTLEFRHIKSVIFVKKWLVDDIVSALQFELNLYYPGYQIRYLG
jgi:hypothetical protein